MGLNKNFIFKNIITGIQDDTSELTLITGVTQDDPSTLTSRSSDSNKSSNVTPDERLSKNLVASSPLKKYPIHRRETSEPHGSKTFYTGSDSSFHERSLDEENIEKYKLMGELSKKEK